MVTLDELKHLCLEGESYTIEFKRDLSDDVLGSMSTSLVAFANTEGGWILVGVDDDRQPVGFSPRARHEDRNRVSAEAKNCIPAVQVEFEDLTLGPLAFLILKVPKSNALHCDKQKKYPVRIGSAIHYLDPAGIFAKLQALTANPQTEIMSTTWGDFVGSSVTSTTLRTDPIPEPRKPSKPSVADVKLFLKAIQSEDLPVQVEGIEQLRRASWEHHSWYDKRLFPRLREILGTGDEKRVLPVLQILRSGIEISSRGKRSAVLDTFRDVVVALCTSETTAQIRAEALQLLKEARDREVVDIIAGWGPKLDDAAFKELPLPTIFSNLHYLGFSDRLRRRLLTELTSAESEVVRTRVLALLKALREHGR